MIPKDKLMHLGAGFVISAAVGFAALQLLPMVICFLLAIGAASVAGHLKEDYDAEHPDTHTYDKQDMYYTIIGGVIGSVFGIVMIPYLVS